MSHPIAELELLVAPVGQPPRRTRLVLSAPVQTPATAPDWSCAVSLAPLWAQAFEIHGENAVQALCLAARLAVQLLDDVLAQGGSVTHLDGSALDTATFGLAIASRTP